MKVQPGEVLAIDIVEMEVSCSLREALAKATKSRGDCHLLLDARTIPILQGIGTRNEVMKRDCDKLVQTIYENTYVVLCPGPEKELQL